MKKNQPGLYAQVKNLPWRRIPVAARQHGRGRGREEGRHPDPGHPRAHPGMTNGHYDAEVLAAHPAGSRGRGDESGGPGRSDLTTEILAEEAGHARPVPADHRVAADQRPGQ